MMYCITRVINALIKPVCYINVNLQNNQSHTGGRGDKWSEHREDRG